MVMQTKQALKIAICGLGRAFVLTLPSLLKYPGIDIVGGIDPQEDTLELWMDEIIIDYEYPKIFIALLKSAFE